MTQEQQASVIGRVALEHAQLGREIAAISSELDRAAELYYKLGIALRQPLTAKIDSGLAEFGWERLSELVTDLREKKAKHEQLSQRLKELGV